MLFRAFVMLVFAATLGAQKYSLAIVEKKAGALGFYSPEGKRLSGVKLGEHPHEIVVAADGRTAYISDNGILWMQYAGEGGNTISVVDLKSRTKLANAATCGRCSGTTRRLFRRVFFRATVRCTIHVARRSTQSAGASRPIGPASRSFRPLRNFIADTPFARSRTAMPTI